MTEQELLQLPEAEQNIFYAKLIHAVKHNKIAREHAVWSVGLCENLGVFNSVKFGPAVFNEDGDKALPAETPPVKNRCFS